jgi:hypothetical protein
VALIAVAIARLDMINPLIAACESLYQEGLTVSAVFLERMAPGNWEARISINVYMPEDEIGDQYLPGGYKIKLDKKNLPKGVSCMDISRYPDKVFMVKASDEGAEALIKELAEVGQAIDFACFEQKELGTKRWLTKPNKWLKKSNWFGQVVCGRVVHCER